MTARGDQVQLFEVGQIVPKATQENLRADRLMDFAEGETFALQQKAKNLLLARSQIARNWEEGQEPAGSKPDENRATGFLDLGPG